MNDLVNLGAFAALGPVYKGLVNGPLSTLPSSIKPWAATAAAVALGVGFAVSQGQPAASGILPGLVMAGTAAWHHDKQAGV